MKHVALSTTLLVVLLAAVAHGEQTQPLPWLDPAGIRGSLVIAGGGKLPKAARERFVELAGGKQARIVVVPTASARAAELLASEMEREALLSPWREQGASDVQVFHAEREGSDSGDDALKPLREATGVWFDGGDQSRIATTYLGTPVEGELAALLARGGVIGGTSAGAAIQSRVMIAGGQTEPRIATGLDLLPGAIIDQHFIARNRRGRLIAAIGQHKDHFGLGIDEATAVIVRGRKLEVVGDSTATVVLAESADRPLREIVLKHGDEHDLTMLRRAALERSLGSFPPAKPQPPRVEKGALVIVGGGRMSQEIVRKFIELAGGTDSPIVVLPIANGDAPQTDSASETRLFDRAGATNVKALAARTRVEVESPEFEAALREAKGVWFGGGRQWRFVDAYQGTKAEELFRDVLRRGGVIGGSSAGASIQAEYMVRGSPLGNTDMMAEGYERGLGFLPGVAIDQHFTQRRRQADLAGVVERYPQLLGIGIDEATALVVRGQTGQILGPGAVHFYTHADGQLTTQSIEQSQRYDLVERKPIE